MAQESDPRQIVMRYHHGSVAPHKRNVGSSLLVPGCVVVDSWAPELIYDHTWLTSEGNLDGLLEHVSLSSLLGLFVALSEEEREKHWICHSQEHTRIR